MITGSPFSEAPALPAAPRWSELRGAGGVRVLPEVPQRRRPRREQVLDDQFSPQQWLRGSRRSLLSPVTLKHSRAWLWGKPARTQSRHPLLWHLVATGEALANRFAEEPSGSTDLGREVHEWLAQCSAIHDAGKWRPGLLVTEAPLGEGKTAAAWACLAEHLTEDAYPTAHARISRLIQQHRLRASKSSDHDLPSSPVSLDREASRRLEWALGRAIGLGRTASRNLRRFLAALIHSLVFSLRFHEERANTAPCCAREHPRTPLRGAVTRNAPPRPRMVRVALGEAGPRRPLLTIAA